MVSQNEFRAALLDAGLPVPDGLLNAEGSAAGKRFSVYRNNVAVSLGEALETSFPILAKLLGPENFRQLAGIFLRQHPPESPLMMHYGAAMPAFLEGFEPLAHIGYLPDVARLEQALRQSYHAADAAPLDPQTLATLDESALLAASFEIAPATQIIRSPWPLYDIWRFNTEDGAPKPQAVAQDVLVVRVDYDPAPHVLPPGGADWLDAIARGASLGAAQDAALAANPEFDLGGLLGLLLTTEALSGLKTAKETS